MAAKTLTPLEQVTAMVAAAIYANLARDVLDHSNGWTREQIVAEAREVAALVVGTPA